MEILPFGGLRNENNSLEFEGGDHGGAGVSFFLVDAAPGRAPPCTSTTTPRSSSCSRAAPPSAEATPLQEVSAGHVVVVPAGEPHGFTASGDGSRQINMHASPRFVTEWLEEEAYG